jgi:hypothetical protein
LYRWAAAGVPNRRSRTLLATTKADDAAIAAPAMSGLRKPAAASVARSVAKFTVARTLSIALRVFSTRAAHAAQVIPRTERSTSRGADEARPVTAADDT